MTYYRATVVILVGAKRVALFTEHCKSPDLVREYCQNLMATGTIDAYRVTSSDDLLSWYNYTSEYVSYLSEEDAKRPLVKVDPENS